MYSKGFQAIILFAALVPLKEGLEHGLDDENFKKLRIARNALCHCTYDFNSDGTITFHDRNKTLKASLKEVIDLANDFLRQKKVIDMVDDLLKGFSA